MQKIIRRQKPLYTYVELDDKTPIQKLTVTDQIRVLIRNLFKSDAEELKAEDAAVTYRLQLKANLLEFIKRAVNPIREGKRQSVTVEISSVFVPVLDEVMNSHRIANFYNTEQFRPKVEYAQNYKILVRLEVKRFE
jgi:hypothetical protein